MRQADRNRPRALALLSLLSAALAAPLAGCYSSWPPIETADPLGNVNWPQNRAVMARAAQWAISHHQPQGSVAFNLPEGMRRSRVLEVVSAAGPQAVPLTPETATTATIYHIPRVWIRKDRAEVDVMVPKDDGYSMTTLRLRGGGSGWTIETARQWNTLTREVPPLYYLPATDEIAPRQAEPPAEAAPAGEEPMGEQ